MLNLFDLNFYRLETTSRKLLSLEQNSNIIKLDKDITYDSKIFPKLTIISQGLARGTSKNNIFKNCNNYPDLLVVDEAHGARKYPVRSSTSETIFRELLMEIKPKVKHIILATATPMRASVDEYYYLLEI